MPLLPTPGPKLLASSAPRTPHIYGTNSSRFFSKNSTSLIELTTIVPLSKSGNVYYDQGVYYQKTSDGSTTTSRTS